ncbi:hypothetical protein PC128_g14480 [Phytophthora cactorum]|nr:hypothetical protein PC120_g14711 [Phytophthora cactorum]KAG3182852.1 hypothetical protein PC128_g14480 [Phytophthora cactorum]KAG4048403.1 hypothetical protein PC123_g16260 [Phytophthora cactorum]
MSTFFEKPTPRSVGAKPLPSPPEPKFVVTVAEFDAEKGAPVSNLAVVSPTVEFVSAAKRALTL